MTVDWSRVEKRLAGVVRRVDLRAGEVLFRTDEPSFGMFLLHEGAMRLTRCAIDGREAVLHAVRPGESFAEPSLFSETYHCDCRADLASRISVLPKLQMLALVESDGQFARLFASRLAGQVRNLRARVEVHGIRQADERVLAALGQRCRSPDGVVDLEGTLKDFAAEIGLTHEALYRALARLERARRIERDRSRLRLLPPVQVAGA